MKAPIVLVGHPGSQKIVKASKYLTEKYLPGFNVIYLNYKGGINGWGAYIADFLRYLTDDFVIFGLDDYLISEPIDMQQYNWAQEEVDTKGWSIVKLCHCSKEENQEYPVTTQYCLWDKEYLISLLLKTYTPWRFEIEGSKMFDRIFSHRPCIKYYTNSSLSSRWEGIRLEGLKEEDLNYIKENGLLV